MTQAYYQQTEIQILGQLGTDKAKGLSSDEVVRRQAQYGPNVLKTKARISPIKLFIEQFKDFLIIILLLAAVVSMAIGIVNKTQDEVTDGILILVIVLAVAVVGFLNEYKAEKTIAALKKLVGLKAKVTRDGEVSEIDSKDLVPGDIVQLEEGGKIPADIRLTQAINLKVNESSLTGESMDATKHLSPISAVAALGDQKNMAFSGTTITAGKAEGVVVGVGSNTEIGKIATMVELAEDDETPMQKKLDHLAKQLGYIILGVCALVFMIIFFFDKETLNFPLFSRLSFAFIAAVALAVAAIPEGLAFVVRISLALGARRMAKRNALIRRLVAVEALGSTDTICTDKTGTLTKGEMTVRAVWFDRLLYEVTGTGYDSNGELRQDNNVVDSAAVTHLLKVGVLCNNSHLKDGKIIGDTTEGALLVSGLKGGLVAKDLMIQYPRTFEVPFTSDRKLMSTVHRDGDGHLVATKGAVEEVLSKSTQIWLDGKPQPLTEALKQQVLAQNTQMSRQTLRVLGLAFKPMSDSSEDPVMIESDLIFLGLAGMMDPPRTEIAETIKRITTEAGLKVVMITGDHLDTAEAVAREVGISGEAITGMELDQLSAEAFGNRVEQIAIYARVNPEHKLRIVEALKKLGHQVAMTGDGVNDAPAIKAADIGIAMGITGTDVAKETADVILLDDNFLTIVSAIEEGRGIFDNIRKFVNYLVSSNIAEVLIVVTGIILYQELALIALQLLFINIVTDGLPAVALGSDPAEKGIMKFTPKRFQSEIINRRLWLEMFAFGTFMTIAVMIAFAFNLRDFGVEHAVAVAFTATVVLELVRLIGLRSDYKISLFSNPWLIVAIVSSLALQFVLIYTPGVNARFGASGVGLMDWVYIGVSAVLIFGAMKITKAFLAKKFPDQAMPATAYSA